MLGIGDRVPDARLSLAPRESVSIRELASDGPVLFLFYLFDWSGT